jgi:hypothetical protein
MMQAPPAASETVEARDWAEQWQAAYTPQRHSPALYTQASSLLDQLRPPRRRHPFARRGLAPVRLLRGSWLLSRAEQLQAATTDEQRRALALPRRQALEATDSHAFLSGEEVAALPRGRPEAGSPLRLVAISYCWLTQDKPDPLGEQLVTFAAKIRSMRAPQPGGAMPFPPGEFAVFFDWCSLAQKDERGRRAGAEQTAFDAALRTMGVWYASLLTTVVCLSELPAGWEQQRGYLERGWPGFEAVTAVIAKSQGPFTWAPFNDAGGRLGVRPPPTPQLAFAARMVSRSFTNGSDRSLVAGLYADVLSGVLGGAEALWFENLPWTDAEAVAGLGGCLHLCKVARDLLLSGTAVGDGFARTVADALDAGHLPRLTTLDVQHTAISEEGEALLRAAAARAAMGRAPLSPLRLFFRPEDNVQHKMGLSAGERS